MEQTLFHKYGGFSTISRIVLDLYDRLLDDDEIGPFFDNVEMSRIVDHQTKFISSLLGGPASYTDEQIGQLHRHLTIRDEHFDRLKSVLADTLRDHHISEQDVQMIISEFEKRRRTVVD